MLLVGWGAFNLVEGLVDHVILGIHHARDGLGGPVGWDLAFVALGALQVSVVSPWRGGRRARGRRATAYATGRRSRRRRSEPVSRLRRRAQIRFGFLRERG